MNKQRFFHAFTGLMCVTLTPKLLMALPTSPEVIEGAAAFSVENQHTMVVQAADHAIIHYQSFNIAEHETVRFEQPSSSAAVLNRVVGSGASEVLGRIQSNGQVFLVNADGVFFGKNAQVDIGSLIASTLDISNEDFLQSRYAFSISPDKNIGEIINLGTISTLADGVVALVGPVVKNEGTIAVQTGKVLLAAAEKVTLDLIGDGSMQFAVEGALEKALIEQAGAIEAQQGQVHLALGQIKDVVRSVINIEGVEVGSTLVQENGVIRLVSSSSISAQEVHIVGGEGSFAEVNGMVDVSNPTGRGGNVFVFAEEIHMPDAYINASGNLGGGTILVGGDAHGHGGTFLSSMTQVGEKSVLQADAWMSGSGGKIVVWSNERTYFDGKASAEGGLFGGNGGFVETSGKLGLGLQVGTVSTAAPSGKSGTWLLDPLAIVINSSGTASLNAAENGSDITSTVVIHPDVFSSATSNIVLSAMAENGSITLSDNMSITVPDGYGISFEVNPETGMIYLQDRSLVQTLGGAVDFNGKVTLQGDNISINTQSGNVYFDSTVDGTMGMLSNLSINAGETGIVSILHPMGSASPVGQFTVQAGGINLGSRVMTKGQSILVTAPTTLVGNSVLDSTMGGAYPGADITFAGAQSTIDGPYSLIVESGKGSVLFDADVGKSRNLYSLKVKGAKTYVSGSFEADGNTLIYESPVVIGANVTFTDNGTSGVFFLSTLDSGSAANYSATVSAPIGQAYFVGNVGGGTALSSLTVSASQVIQVGTVHTLTTSGSSAVSYTGPVGITVGGNITAGGGGSYGTISFSNPVLFAPNTGTAITMNLVSGGGTSTASSITVQGATTGSGNVVITGDTFTQVAFQNNAVNLTSLSVTSVDSITQDSNSAISATGNVTLNPSSGAFNKKLATQATISTTSGSIALTGGVTTATVASNILAGTGNITLTPSSSTAISYQGVLQTDGGTITAAASAGSQDLILTGATNVEVGSGSASFNKIDGAQSLSVSGGAVASLTFSSTLGGTTPLSSITAAIGSITQSSTAATTGGVTYSAATSISNAGNITSSGGAISVTGPVTLTGSGTRTFTASGNISFNTNVSTIDGALALVLTPGTTAVATLGASVGNLTPLTSVTINRGAQANVASNINTTGAISFTPAVVLSGTSAMSSSSSGAITFSSTLNGTQVLDVNTAGAVTFGGVVGGVSYLAGLNAAGGSIAVNTTAVNVIGGATTFNGPVTLGSNITFTNDGIGVSFLSTIAGGGGSPTLTVSTPTGDATFVGAIASSVGAFTVTALSIEQLGSVSLASGSSLSYTGYNSILISSNITLGGSGSITVNNPATLGSLVTFTTATGGVTLSGILSGSDGLTISSSGGAITLGSSSYDLASLTVTTTGSGTITQNSASPISTTGALSLTAGGALATNASLLAAGGNITLSGSSLSMTTTNVTTTGGNVNLTGTGGITYNGGVFATGNGSLTVNNALTLATGSTNIDVGSGSATFSSTINGAQALSVNGSSIGTMTLSGAVGGTTPLSSFLAQIGNIVQSGALSTSGAISYNAAGSISVGGNLTSSAGTISSIGPITLTSGVTYQTTGQNISFVGSSSTIDSNSTARALTVTTGVSAGNIRFDGALGANSQLASLSVTCGGNMLEGSSVGTTGTQTYAANIILTGATSMTASNNITFSGKIDGAQSLFVNAGGGVVTYGAAIGSSTPLSSLDTVASSIVVNTSTIKVR